MNHRVIEDGLDDEDLENLSGSFDEEAYEEELSYKEILANLTMNREIILTIPVEQEEGLKSGLKNLKAKQVAKLKADDLPVPEEVLEFSSKASTVYDACVDVHIILRKKAAVTVKKIVIPDNTL